MNKRSKGWDWAKNRYCVEDPLLPDIDVAHTSWEAPKIDAEFNRGWDILKEFLLDESIKLDDITLESVCTQVVARLICERDEDY